MLKNFVIFLCAGIFTVSILVFSIFSDEEKNQLKQIE